MVPLIAESQHAIPPHIVIAQDHDMQRLVAFGYWADACTNHLQSAGIGSPANFMSPLLTLHYTQLAAPLVAVVPASRRLHIS